MGNSNKWENKADEKAIEYAMAFFSSPEDLSCEKDKQDFKVIFGDFKIGYLTGLKDYKESLKKELVKFFPNSYLVDRLNDIIDTVQP